MIWLKNLRKVRYRTFQLRRGDRCDERYAVTFDWERYAQRTKAGFVERFDIESYFDFAAKSS